MEKETITFEIKREVSITLVWIVAGMIIVTSTFLIASQSVDLWASVNAGGIAVILYLIALVGYSLRKPVPRKTRIAVVTATVVVLVITVFACVRMEDQTRWQAGMLSDIRATIGRGIMRSEMSKPLLVTLDQYHRQGRNKKSSLADVFKKMHSGVVVGVNIYQPKWKGDSMSVVVETLNPDRIVLVSQEVYVKGKEPQFRNLNGRVGMVQERFILTKRGLEHVSDN
jgi:hypothetical protein